ncbi:MAG: hypothetical protein J6B06_01480 [Lachnospiraceae bacterium]|nr:hypothetical protein [Lachnospiraceae bacterium]
MTQKKLKKRLFALLAAAMLVASQTGAVCATGLDVSPVTAVTESSAAEENSSAEVAESTKVTEEVQGETSETAAEKQTEENQASAGAGAVEGETTEAETETTEAETTGAETAESGARETTPGGENAAETAAGAQTETIVAAETTAGEKKVFTDKNGEEIQPESLIGVDYDTVSENYDGETNVIKQFELSDEYEANTIMDSYVDEEGNLIMIISQRAEKAATMGLEAVTADSLDSNSDSPSIDGSFSGWDDIPVSYEYNWDNSQNCWNWGVWVDGEKYTTEEGTYDTNVRHGMQMYTDGENVYLNVTFAREFSNGQVANGNDYQFWVDGQMAAYQVEWPDGRSLSNSQAEPGVYEVDVRHRDSSWSYVLTDGAQAYYKVNDGNLNNQLELKIPLDEFVKQNGNIDLENYSMIQFFSPNLMYNRISAAGSPTGSIPFAAAAFTLVPASCMWIKKKKR